MLSALQAAIGFIKEPMNPGDDGRAFMSFAAFASGPSDIGRAMRNEFSQGRGTFGETPRQTAAAFFDWLIASYWGEAESVAGA